MYVSKINKVITFKFLVKTIIDFDLVRTDLILCLLTEKKIQEN